MRSNEPERENVNAVAEQAEEDAEKPVRRSKKRKNERLGKETSAKRKKSGDGSKGQ